MGGGGGDQNKRQSFLNAGKQKNQKGNQIWETKKGTK